jgi:hypothetical protein
MQEPAKEGFAMRRFTGRLSLTMMFAGLMLATSVPMVRAALDQTPPTLTVPVRPSFVVGNVVDDYSLSGYWFANNIAQLSRWSATDNVGVSSYDFWFVLAGGPPGTLLDHSQETQYTFMAGDYEDDFGGGSGHVEGFLVTARDTTGNATTKAMTDSTLIVIQENGSSATTYEWPQSISYTGPWTQTNCECFLAEHTLRTSTSGARATFTRTYVQGDQVALVMAMGPGRGKASIRLDGNWLMNIETFASVNTNRVVVFQRGMTAGVHTIAIVNQATPGRPRIDLDAILINTDNEFGT